MEKTIIGFKENVLVGINGKTYKFTATMDTGNAGHTPTLGVKQLLYHNKKLNIILYDNSEIIKENLGELTPMVGNVMHYRPIINLDFLEIKGKRIENVNCAITDQRHKTTQMLINRNIMSQMNFIVDPSIDNINGGT